MFAVIETGGKQYKVSEGMPIKIEKLSKIDKKEKKITFDKVLLLDDGQETRIGLPYIKEAKVEATIEDEGKGKKITVIRFKAKSRYSKVKGHRQPYMKVRISKIS